MGSYDNSLAKDTNSYPGVAYNNNYSLNSQYYSQEYSYYSQPQYGYAGDNRYYYSHPYSQLAPEMSPNQKEFKNLKAQVKA